MKSSSLHISRFLSILILCSSPALAADWYQWRGPEQNGVSREKNLPETWDLDTGENLLWTNRVGGMSSPIVMNGRAYTLTRTGEVPFPADKPNTLIPGPQTQEAVVCIDAETGRVLWEHRENITQTEVPFHRVGWANVVGDPDSGRIYAYFVDCTFLCLNGETGQVLWRRQMTEEFGMISTFGGRTPSPAIDEDQVIIGGVAFGWGDHARTMHRLFAFNKHNGELNWTNGTGLIPADSPYNTPVIAIINGERLAILGTGDGGVHAFQSRTGKHVWQHKISKRGINASVIVDGSRVYACSSEENVDSPVMGQVVCLDVASGTPEVVWRVDGLEVGFSSPTFYEGVLYVFDNGGTVHALDAATGQTKWKKRAGRIGKASLVYADGKLYVPEGNGQFVIMKPDANRAEILSKFELSEKLGREFAIFGSVAIANGRIYLQTANSMYCIGPKNPQVASDPIPPMPREVAANPEGDHAPAAVQVRPADLVLRPGDKASFTVFTFDAKGRALGQAKPDKWSIGQLIAPVPPGAPQPERPVMIGNLQGQVDPDGAFTAADGPHQGGAIVATLGDLCDQARVRVLPPLPWKFDFEEAPVGRPPLIWIGAGGKFAVSEDEQNKVLTKLTNFDLYYRASTNFGTVNMSNYTVQADVRAGEKIVGADRHIPDPGIINSRYVLLLMGSHQRLVLYTWPPSLPYSLNRTIDYEWEPDTWYRMKLRVDQAPGKAIVKGKVWKVGSAEPDQWTVELEDPMPNREGNPGLFGHSLVTPYKSEIHYDNIEVTENR